MRRRRGASLQLEAGRPEYSPALFRRSPENSKRRPAGPRGWLRYFLAGAGWRGSLEGGTMLFSRM